MLEIRGKRRGLLTRENQTHDGCPSAHMTQENLVSPLVGLNSSTCRVRSTVRRGKWRNRHTELPSLGEAKFADQGGFQKVQAFLRPAQSGRSTCSVGLYAVES